MKFVNTQYLTYAFVAIIVFGILLNRLNSQFFKWVKSYWFFDRTMTSRISTVLYTISLFLMMTALLDLRGPEKKIKANIPDQRTIILIDSSTSMLAEDVRPNRFVKSLQLARHFVKNAAGHQISIVLFSDIQKRLIPFTDDIDLIDSRLAALEKNNSVAGGSNISQAIEEAIQYFEFDSSDDDKSKSGNMLVFTDAEESEGAFKVNIPPNVNLAIVGTGTLKGANIPLRWEDGSFRGYKTFKGEPVITKLDENYIRKMGQHVKNFKYWIANSYSLPTDEIINFFRSAFSNKQSTGDLRIRPVFSHYILIPAILLYCLSILIGRFPIFKVSKNLILVFGLLFGLSTQAPRVEAEEELPKAQVLTTPEIKKDLELIQEGKADREYVLKTAEKMLRAKDAKRATELYSEYAKKNDSEEVRFNYATSLLKSNRLKDALPIIQDLMKNSKNEDLKDKLRKNLRTHIEQKKKQEKKDKQKKENEKDNKDKKDDKQNQGQGNQPKEDDKKNQEGKDQKKDGKQQGQQNKQQDKQQDKQQGKQDNQQNQKSGQGQPQNGEDKKENKPESKKEDKKDGKGKEDKDKDKEGEGKEEDKQTSGPSTLEEKEKEIEQKRRMTKTPAMIKQIMNDDRDLQKKMMDTSTNERGEQKPKRDW
ncbi:MAG: VWA domain-containing protein [Bacteriovorax sp.]|nr:VWA domain-containing protein [Bacteriovorax sp.]